MQILQLHAIPSRTAAAAQPTRAQAVRELLAKRIKDAAKRKEVSESQLVDPHKPAAWKSD